MLRNMSTKKNREAYISFKGMSRKGAKARPLFQFPSLRVNAEDIKMRKKRTEVPALTKVKIGEALKREIPVGKLARDFNVDAKTVYRCGQALDSSLLGSSSEWEGHAHSEPQWKLR